MASVTTDRRRGINSGAAIKTPCIAASTANVTLSGEQTIDGVSLVTDDRVLLKDQTTATENGIYAVNTSTWSREPDFDGKFDVVEGTIVPVSRGTANATTYWRITNTGSITIGTTSLTFAVTSVLDSAILRDGSVKMIADFSPNVDATYDLGTALLQWVNGLFSGDIIAQTYEATGDTAANDNATMGYTATEGLILTGQGSTNDVTIKNDADAIVARIPTGTTTIVGASGNEVFGQFVIKSSDESITDSAALQDDDDLFVTLAANGVYEIETMLIFKSTSSTPGAKWSWIEADGTFGATMIYGEELDSTAAVVSFTEANTTFSLVFTGNNILTVWAKFLVTAAGSGGVFKLQWAQAVSNATATVCEAGSYMKVLKLA